MNQETNVTNMPSLLNTDVNTSVTNVTGGNKIVIFVLSLVSIFTICGNLFVILSVLLKDQLRRVRSNMFIISLGKSEHYKMLLGKTYVT